MQDPTSPTFTDDGQAPVKVDWPIATTNSPLAGAFKDKLPSILT